ncbi:HAMP domain-containing protein [Palleronia sediminis]|uniref:histidine kinase n=1 Tax=Palleronia sediminis TaxID=2547833 RepID=A0A4R6AI79_9RHOB|nr:ATP-binding protein [Palleronia sediminis]TDL81073.1 HAMP domain-containing protein [Palleronia sediminis]
MSLRRLTPDRLGARLALLLAAALIAANLVALGLLAAQRAQQGRAALVEREAERIVSLVPAIEAAAPAARRAIAHDASTRFSRVTVAPAPVVETVPTAPRSAALTRELAAALNGRPVRAAIRVRPDRGGDGPREAIAVSIGLAVPAGDPAQWLNVVTRGPGRPPSGLDGGVFLVVLGLSLVSVLGAALLYLRRLTRPLGALAGAARAAGRGDRAARVPERGPREMREAAAAFNDMQARIARFDAERMRTLAAVGHDLRTPITSLRIRAEMLDEEGAAPMIRTLDEMAVMADGLVAYASGAGDAEKPRCIDLADLLAALCEARGASLDVTETVEMVGRPVALGRAIGNLVDNALRYGGMARVRLARGADGAIVTVEDDGPGIPPERLGAMFDPFVRGDASRSMETGGAGLGLSIARSVVTAHGGEVTLENRAEGGLRATVRLPAARES